MKCHVDIYEDKRKKWRWRFISELEDGSTNIEFVKTDPVNTLEEAEEHFMKFVTSQWHVKNHIHFRTVRKRNFLAWLKWIIMGKK